MSAHTGDSHATASLSAGLLVLAAFGALCMISMVWAGATILGLIGSDDGEPVVRALAWAMISAPFVSVLLVSVMTEPSETTVSADEEDKHEGE